MNKVKMFFIASALVLATVGVFAGKAKFANTIYGYSTVVGYANVTATIPPTTLMQETVNGQQIKVTDGASVTYSLYEFDGSVYHPLYPGTNL